jgi:hypothetical protein
MLPRLCNTCIDRLRFASGSPRSSVTTIQAATMGFNLADATRLGNGELCARGFGKSWIGAQQTILGGKKLGALGLLSECTTSP